MKQRAFTLIELLVVISIISILASVVLAALNTARDKGRVGAGRYFAAQVDHIASDYAVGMWDFDECSNTTAADRSGYGSNLTFVNSPTSSPNSPYSSGCSMSFNGVNQYMSASIATNPQLNVSGDVTLSAWIYPTTGFGVGNIVRSGSVADEVFGFFYSGSSNILQFQIYNGSFSSVSSQSNIAKLNQWTHVAAVRNASTITFYANGMIAGTATLALPSASPATLEIGAYADGGGGQFNGNIDGVHVFAKALTASEIRNIYAAEKSDPRFASK